MLNDHILGHPNILAYEGWELGCVPWTYAIVRAYITLHAIEMPLARRGMMWCIGKYIICFAFVDMKYTRIDFKKIGIL